MHRIEEIALGYTVIGKAPRGQALCPSGNACLSSFLSAFFFMIDFRYEAVANLELTGWLRMILNF